MGNWRSHILKEFTPRVARLTLVADPDNLLLEQDISDVIRDRGFHLIPFEDHVEFRYVYEKDFRSKWDKGEETDLVVILKSPNSDLNELPYDLLQAGRKLSFNLGEIFPNLSYPVIEKLDLEYLDSLYNAQFKYSPDVLGDKATREFILRHVFQIAPEMIRNESELLRVLMRRHYLDQKVPGMLDDHFISLLKQEDIFKKWPLELIVPDREAFFGFLQERWSIYLDNLAEKEEKKIHKSDKQVDLKYPGPMDLPFENNDVRVYLDNLFLDGFLETSEHEKAEILSKTWVSIGLKTEPKRDIPVRFSGLLEKITDNIPDEDANFKVWFNFARSWAELLSLVYSWDEIDQEKKNHVKDLQSTIDNRFMKWTNEHYVGIFNRPPNPPLMLHHVPRFMAYHIDESKKTRAALIVIDGLSLDQWVLIQNELSGLSSRMTFREGAVFAWIPTITSVSRQALFAGKPPVYFPGSINHTNAEPKLWSHFWANEGLADNEITYVKDLGREHLQSFEEHINPKTRVVGIVLSVVDKIMHGIVLGKPGMHNQIRQWVHEGHLAELLMCLVEKGFRIYLTSDHGNIEATGCGRIAEGAIADSQGQRVRIYSSESLRSRIKDQCPNSIEWKPAGLPNDYFPLIAGKRTAFIKQDDCIVAHGGITLEEVIVPFIEIEGKY